MKKIESKILVFSFIVQTYDKEISIEKFFEYVNVVRSKIKGTEYYIDKMGINEVSNILSMYSFIAHFSNSKIIIDDIDSAHYKINKFILKDVDEELKKYLVKGEKFIFPIIYEKNLILYKFNSTDLLLNSIKEKFCCDKKNDNAYIINLDTANKSIDNIEEYILNLILSSKIQRDIINHDDLIDFINYIDGLVNNKNKFFEDYFGITKQIEEIHESYKVMDEYHLSAGKNTALLGKNKDSVRKLFCKN